MVVRLVLKGWKMTMRLQKYMAKCGVASRRYCEKLIAVGEVKVNDKVIDTFGYLVDPQKDIVKVRDKVIMLSSLKLYILFNKPQGVLTTMKDYGERKIVLDYIKDIEERVYPVGRLDMDSEGLLLLTNDGELANRLMHPSHKVEKHYLVTIRGFFTKDNCNSFESGLVLENEEKTAPATIEIIERNWQKSLLKIVLREGKKRQIRRMMRALNHPVSSLKRVGISFLTTEGLKTGQYRYLSKKEEDRLKQEVGMP